MNLRKKALFTVSSAVSGNEPATTYICNVNEDVRSNITTT